MGRRRQASAAAPSLPVSFFERDTAEVARDLLGCVVVRRFGDGREASAVLVETEAYLGVADPAAHTWNGRRTPRVSAMWGPAGRAYVFRVYGRNDCLNVVTREEGVPEAVLLRAAVPLAWWDGAPLGRAELLAASGPGRLCRYLGVTTVLSGAPLSGPELFVRAGGPRPFGVLSGPRVGVGYAGEAAAWPLRFAVSDCPAVTARRALRPGGPASAR